MMTRKKNPKSNEQTRIRPNEATLRASYLEQAANLLASTSKSVNDGPALLSKMYVDELKEVKFTYQILTEKEVRRSRCTRCNRIWVENGSGDNGMRIKVTKTHIIRKCTDCGAVKKLVRNKNYKSRNEKAAKISN
ncbi:hypothetical protein FO519_007037 [Halicephalobus sp. NKZ332]|nr:hypothetical protein FO519_007037 [Halicephalobus sp. NKZ332]